MANLNDSGYSSPRPKCPNGDEKLVLRVVRGSTASTGEKVTANANDFLASVLKQKYPKMNVAKTLIWTEIRGHHGKKCVNPFTLPCGLIEPDKEIEMQDVKKIVCEYIEKLQDTKPYSKPLGYPFFISIRDRKGKALITKIPYQDFKYNDICVVAKEEQTLYDALESDSRFKDVDHFILREKSTGDSFGINERPCHLKTGYVFEVKKKLTRSTCNPTKVNPNNSPATSTVEHPDSTPIIRKSINFDKLAEKLVEKRVVYDFSKEAYELTAQEILNEMDSCLRARAWSSLIGPEDRAGSRYKKGITKIAEIQFANNYITARPTSFSKALYPLYDSIGYIKCGSVVDGTCFLISKCMIVTNWHVVQCVNKDRKDVLVYFDYEEHGKKGAGVKLMPLSYSENKFSKEFDYAFLYLQDAVESTRRKPLGPYVRCQVPEFGNTCIVAHPNGKEKQEELCPIIPLHESRRSLELERRLAEKEGACAENPNSCTLTTGARECICVHLYNQNIKKLYGDKSVMTYDVGSMFEGSSGAPVFDMSANIVALHTRGFRLETTSVVEVGITFEAIINHLKACGCDDFVKENFPSCFDEAMDFTNEDLLDGMVF